MNKISPCIVSDFDRRVSRMTCKGSESRDGVPQPWACDWHAIFTTSFYGIFVLLKLWSVRELMEKGAEYVNGGIKA